MKSNISKKRLEFSRKLVFSFRVLMMVDHCVIILSIPFGENNMFYGMRENTYYSNFCLFKKKKERYLVSLYKT